jgi:hypothetical protein
MEKEGWREQFRVEGIAEEKELKTEVHIHHDNGRCLRAKGFKCVCKCCGAYHGELTRKNMPVLETWSEKGPQPTIDTSEIEQVFVDTLKQIQGPIEFTHPISGSLF